MKNKLKGEVIVEAAIVIPILLLIVISLIYFAFYIHDLLIIKSYAYSSGIESANYNIDEFSREVKTKISNAPILVIEPVVQCYKDNFQYIIEVNGRGNSRFQFLNNIIASSNFKIKIQQSIERADMYAIRSLMDAIGE